MPTLGAGETATHTALFHGGTGGVRIALHAKLFPSLLSYEGTLSGVLGSLVLKIFSGSTSPDPQMNTI